MELSADVVQIRLDLSRAYPSSAGHRQLWRQIRLDCKTASLTVEDLLWAEEACRLGSVRITASDDTVAVGLESLPGSELVSKESLEYRDNRGEDVTAWRWRWQATNTPPSSEENQPQCVGYRIRPAAG